MKIPLLLIATLMSAESHALDISNFGISIDGSEVKEQMKAISENCKKSGDKEACQKSKKELVTSAIRLPDIRAIKD